MSPLFSRRGRDREPGGPSLLVHGHSLALGAGTSDQERVRFTRLVADRLGLEERNRAVGGAIAHWSTYGNVGDGGYPAVLEETVPCIPPGGAGLLYYGLNDLAVLGANLRPYREALRTMISRYRADVVVQVGESEPTSIELPSDFAGGTVSIGFTVDPSARATASFTIGSRVEDLDLNGAEVCFGERSNALVKRLEVPAEARVIEVDVQGGSRPAIDYWQIEADPPPPVAVLTQFPLDNYDIYAGWPAHPVIDEDVTRTLNPVTREVVAEFDAAVGLVELEDAFPDGYTVAWDAYPDDSGYAHLADVVHPQVAELVGRTTASR